MQTERRPDVTLSNRARGRATTTGHSAEVMFWYFMRISGLILLFLALIHFTATHILTDVVETDYNFIAARWQNPFWRLFDWSLLTLGLSHGILGIRAITEDYIASSRLRVLAKSVIVIVVGGLFLLGTLIIFTFDASGASV